MGGKDDALRVTQYGVTINVTASAVTPTLLPVNSAGNFPRVVRLQSDSNPVYVRLGPATSGTNSAILTPTLNSMMVTSYEPEFVITQGQKYIAAIARSGITANLNVTPLED